MRMLKLWQTLVALTAMAILAAACGGSPAGGASTAAPAAADAPITISVSGAFALFPMMQVWAEAYSKIHPNVTFDVQGGGAGKGMTDMLTGAADIAMLSREVRPEETQQGAFLIPAAIDAVVPTVNANNPALATLLTRGITPQTAAKIWVSGEITTWGQLVGSDDSSTINVYTRSDASGAAEVWVKYLGGKAQEELTGTAVNGDPGVAEAVRQDVLGIGYNNIAFAYDLSTGEPVEGLRVIPIDLNGDGQVGADENFYDSRAAVNAAVAEKRYPYPPARLLYLVTKGQPTPAITAFYRWMLSEGQKLVNDAGFVGLSEANIQEGLSALGE